jgi:uracil-DNA glycosylase family 4
MQKMNDDSNELIEMLRDSREYARFLGELGVETISLASENAQLTSRDSGAAVAPARTSSPAASQIVATATQSLPIPSARSNVPLATAPSDSLFGELAPPQTSFAQSQETLNDVWRDIGDCTRCGLCEGRTQVVNTFGNPRARLMFVGEAPGADEDAQGKPFVGRAGQLLTKMIEAMGMKREEVIIGNVNRCRPPGNRQPTLEEAAICRPFLFREIAAIQPEVIVVMGNTALRNLLEVREGITRVRGKFQDFRGIKVMPTFHPAYLLRDPSKKRETWEDLKMVVDYLEGTAGKRLP